MLLKFRCPLRCRRALVTGTNPPCWFARWWTASTTFAALHPVLYPDGRNHGRGRHFRQDHCWRTCRRPFPRRFGVWNRLSWAAFPDRPWQTYHPDDEAAGPDDFLGLTADHRLPGRAHSAEPQHGLVYALAAGGGVSIGSHRGAFCWDRGASLLWRDRCRAEEERHPARYSPMLTLVIILVGTGIGRLHRDGILRHRCGLYHVRMWSSATRKLRDFGKV